MAPTNSRKTATTEDHRDKFPDIRIRPGCKPAVEIRLPGPKKEKLWIAVNNVESAKKLVEVIRAYTGRTEAFPPDHPDLPQLETFSRKEFEAFVLTELQRRHPSVNQVPGSEERLGQEPGISQSTATKVLADSAHGLDHGMMLTDVPESSSAHFAVDKNLQNLHPQGREAFVLGIGGLGASSIIPEELQIPSTHMQGPASTYHVHQGPGVDQPTATQLLQGALQNFSSADLTHGSDQREIAELMMPTNRPQPIFGGFGVLKNLENGHPPASEALGSNLALCRRHLHASIEGPGSTDHVYQDPGMFQHVGAETLADLAHDFHHGQGVESIMPTDVPESSCARCVPVGNCLQYTLPSDCEAFDFGDGDSVASLMMLEEPQNPSTHVQTSCLIQVPVSTGHLGQGPAIDQPTDTELLEGAVQNLSNSDLQVTLEAATSLNWEEPNLTTRNEGVDGSSGNEAHCTDLLQILWQGEVENSRTEPSNCLEGDLTHGSIQSGIEEFISPPINAPQSIIVEFPESNNSQNVLPLASEALDLRWMAHMQQNIRPSQAYQENFSSLDAHDADWSRMCERRSRERGLERRWMLEHDCRRMLEQERRWMLELEHESTWMLEHDRTRMLELERERRWMLELECERRRMLEREHEGSWVLEFGRRWMLEHLRSILELLRKLLQYQRLVFEDRWREFEIERMTIHSRWLEQVERAEDERRRLSAHVWSQLHYMLELELQVEMTRLINNWGLLHRRQVELEKGWVELDKRQAELDRRLAELDTQRQGCHDLEGLFALLVLVYTIMDLQEELLRWVAQVLQLILSVITFSFIDCLICTTPESLRFTILGRRPTVGSLPQVQNM